MKTEDMVTEEVPVDEKDLLRVNPKTFSENGLLVMGLLGGFALTTLTLVISNESTFNPKDLNWFIGITWNSSQITAGQAYLFSLQALLGIVGFWSIATSFVMLNISSSVHAEQLKLLHKFVAYSVAILCGGFAGILGLLVEPFSPTATWVIVIVSAVITFVFVGLRDEDKKRYLKARKTTTMTTPIATIDAQNKSGDSVPPASREKKAEQDKATTDSAPSPKY